MENQQLTSPSLSLPKSLQIPRGFTHLSLHLMLVPSSESSFLQVSPAVGFVFQNSIEVNSPGRITCSWMTLRNLLIHSASVSPFVKKKKKKKAGANRTPLLRWLFVLNEEKHFGERTVAEEELCKYESLLSLLLTYPKGGSSFPSGSPKQRLQVQGV